jgi:methylenetetrahydrofolate reductase (NADPH)
MSEPVVNALRDGLDRGEFVITLEYCLPPRGESLKALHALADYAASEPTVHAVALTDRVTSEHDYEPLDVAAEIMQRSGKVPLVHISGKDRTPDTIRERLERCAESGLENVLVVTGDMPRPDGPPLNKGGQGGVKSAQVIEPPNGFVDSVQGIHIAGQIGPPLLVASAISTFKYTEPELMNQYIKMHKKVAHGARLIFNQVGYDLRKTQELTWYIRHAGQTVPAIAALYWLAPGFARFARAGNVPGVMFTEDFCRRIEEICKEPDKGEARRTDMMALHILLCKRFGYRGVHIGGLKKPESIARILRRVEELDTDENTAPKLWSKWCGHLKFNDGKPAELGQPNGYYVFAPDGHGLNSLEYAQSNGESYFSPRYALLRAIHAVFFDRGMRPGGVGERVVRGFSRVPGAKRLGYLVERAFKIPLVGCQGCGSCSLPDTEYVCIEGKCAKHLTNGPCGGQRDTKCEAYPDRECAWVEIYRRAKSRGNIAMLMNRFIQPKDRNLKNTCSWINLCLGLDHHGEERKR